MKGLLHSKRFRSNLYKWLFMYMSVMLLLTSVITYSKYLSNVSQVHETARVTKFNVNIDYTDINGNVCTNCNSGIFRPTSKIKYYFTVDSKELEATADLYLTVTANDDFEIIDIKNITNPNSIVRHCSIDNEQQTNSETICTRVEAEEARKVIYEVTLQYNVPISPSLTAQEIPYDRVITVGYSASQVIN